MTDLKTYHIVRKDEKGKWTLRNGASSLRDIEKAFAITVQLYGTENARVFKWIPMIAEVSVKAIYDEAPVVQEDRATES